MLLKIQLILLSLITLDAHDLHTPGSIVIKLNPEQIIDALTSKGSLIYIEKLAHIFATKAAEHFIDQIKNKERNIEIDKGYKLEKLKKFQDRSEKKILGETEALVLMDEPPPDGDNLSSISDELTVTDDEIQVKKKTVPVIGLTKVNGKYFYRRYYMGLF